MFITFAVKPLLFIAPFAFLGFAGGLYMQQALQPPACAQSRTRAEITDHNVVMHGQCLGWFKSNLAMQFRPTAISVPNICRPYLNKQDINQAITEDNLRRSTEERQTIEQNAQFNANFRAMMVRDCKNSALHGLPMAQNCGSFLNGGKL